MMELALGTVQFGLDYGISNKQGQVAKVEVEEILTQALSLGINTLDCAGAYGDSEQVLGELNVSKRFNLISKIPALSHKKTSITPFLEQSLSNLQCDELATLLFHQADDLLTHPNKDKLFSQLALLKKQSIVNEIGVSVYSLEQLSLITEAYDIDIVQAPINIFDQRFIANDTLELCKRKHIKIHARSLFLQGLLFIEPEDLNRYFLPYQTKINAFSALAKSMSCSKLTLALAVLLAQGSHKKYSNNISHIIEKVVVGVCNTNQLREIVNAYQQAKTLDVSLKEIQSLADSRLGLINPSLWQL